MKILRNITAGQTRKLIQPILFTLISNFINIIPFILVIHAVELIYRPFANPGTVLDITNLWCTCGALLISIVIIFIGELPAYRTCYRGAYAVAAEGRAALAEHLRKLPLGYLYGRDPGDLANMLMGDFALIEHSISHIVPQLFGALILPILALIGLAYIDWRMAVAMFVSLPVAILILAVSSGLMRKFGSRHMRAKIDAANRLQEYLNGIRIIRAYNLRGARFERLEKSFRNLMKESIKLEVIFGPIVLSALSCIRAGLTIMIIVGVHLLLGGEINLIVFVMFLVIGTRVFDPLTIALVNYAEMYYSQQAGERIIKLKAEPEMTGESHPPDNCDITLDDVTFSYKDKPVLNNISATMPKDTLTALVGPSGSGKSTILKLIARFYDPQSGKVIYGGSNISHLEPESYLKKVSVVFQDVYLFQDTVGNNIRFGKNDATDGEVIDAAIKACCHDFIMKLPQGYDTPVGEGGCTLSGGEKQRISIARAFLKNAPVVLLDEATASLDPENELEVQKAIDTLIEGRTVVVIAHRLKTICRADNIIVLNDGRIVEEGNHQELLSHDGLYARLWKLQQQSLGWSLSA